MFCFKLLRQGLKMYQTNHVIVRGNKTKFKDGGNLPTFNDCPVPQGSWHEVNAQKQSKYNLILLSGILATVGVIALVTFSDWMVFNITIPDYPYKKEEEDDEDNEENKPK